MTSMNMCTTKQYTSGLLIMITMQQVTKGNDYCLLAQFPQPVNMHAQSTSHTTIQCAYVHADPSVIILLTK